MKENKIRVSEFLPKIHLPATRTQISLPMTKQSVNIISPLPRLRNNNIQNPNSVQSAQANSPLMPLVHPTWAEQNIKTLTSDADERVLNSYLGRINYVYDEKYLLPRVTVLMAHRFSGRIINGDIFLPHP